MHFLFDLAIWVLFQSRFSDVSRDVMLQYLSLLPAHWFARHCMIWKVAQMISCSKRMESPSQQFTSAFGDLVYRFFQIVAVSILPDIQGQKTCLAMFDHKFQIVKIPNWISNMCRIHTPNSRHFPWDLRNVSMWSSCCWSSARRRYHSGKVEARKACNCSCHPVRRL